MNEKELKKKAEEEKQKKPKNQYYTVKVETLAPVTLTYRIFAESPEQASDMALKLGGQKQQTPPLINYGRIRALKAIVYSAGTSMIQFVKNL